MIRKGYLAAAFSFLTIFVPPDLGGGELTLRKEIESSFVVLLNSNGVIPVTSLEKGSFAIAAVGKADVFASRLNDYLQMPVVRIDAHSHESMESGISELMKYDRIIVGISAAALPLNHNNRNMADELIQCLGERESVAVFFGPPLFLASWRGIDKIEGLIVARDDSDMVQDLAAQLVFGAIGASGTLHEAAGDHFPAGWGIRTAGGLRLKYTIPEEVGLDSRIINHRVDSIVSHGLDMKAFPGCRVLVAKGGKVILDRAWGFHTYSGRVAVEKDDIYDLASITKIAGPLPLYMQLVDQGAIDLDKPLSYYWEDWRSRLFRRSNKEDLTLIDLLTHQSGITPWLSAWSQTMRNGNYIRRFFRHEQLDGYTIELGSHLYLRDSFRKRVYREIRRSNLLPHGEYRYSCLPFIVSPEVIERVDGRPYTKALYEDFYKSLGAVSLRYNPRSHFPCHRIVPTEFDSKFRRMLVHGYVHDESAALLDGISGNAGLFSSAGDLAKLFQMYLNGGEYGGRRYLSQEVINQFTAVQFPENNNRRGIGFDKPLLDNNELSPERAYPCSGASSSSFGHSGFTGTFAWMDPEHDLLYIFLSNRVYPSRSNNLISTLNIRTEILQLFYDEILRSPCRTE